MRILFLAGAYFDLLTYFVIVHILGLFVPALLDIPLLASSVAGILLSLTAARFGFSLGQGLISKIKDLHGGSGMPWRVWVSLLMGGFAFLEATKHLVRWTQMDRPMPFFGVIPEGTQQIIHDLGWAVVFLLIAILVLKLHATGKALGITSSLLMIASAWVSWDVLPLAIERQTIARRAAQGIPVRPDEIEFMQTLVPAFLIVGPIMMILLFFACYSERKLV